MYYCHYCGAMNNECEYVRHTESHNETDPTSYEEWYTKHCVYCGSEDIEETKECYLCGEYEAYPIKGEEYLCTDCISKVEQVARKSILEIMGFADKHSNADKDTVRYILADILDDLGV